MARIQRLLEAKDKLYYEGRETISGESENRCSR